MKILGREVKGWPVLVAVALLSTVAAVAAVNKLSFLKLGELALEDFRIANLLKPEPQDPNIVIISITEDTLQLFPYREPVDRGFLADLLETLQARKPKAIGIDVLFDSPTEPDKDDRLKDVIAHATVPLAISYTDNPAEVSDDQLDYLNDFVPQKDRVRANIPEDLIDGKVRYISGSQVMRNGDKMPGFARGLLSQIGIAVPDTDTPIVWHGAPDRDTPTFRTYPAHTVKFLKPEFANLQDKILLIGGYFTLRDRHRTPLASILTGSRGELPGIEVHAHGISQFIDHRAKRTMSLWQETLLVLGFAALGTLLGKITMSTVRRFSIAGGVLLLLIVTGGALTYYTGFLIKILEPALALFLATWATDAVLGAEAKRQREFINSAFARYLNPQLVKRLADDPSKLTLGGESRDMTLLFCDIRGFTTISEKFDAQGLTRFINRFLTPMTDLIMANRGTIDKYMGDAIMAFWNAPLDDPEHAANGCRAALRMRSRLADLNQQWRLEAEAQAQTFIQVNIGIGLNSGMCCVGNVGSDQRFDYSVLGDDVNLASRLEGQSKTYGVDIVIGENTARAAASLAILELDSIMVKGKTKPVQIYALVGDDEHAQEAGFLQLKAEHEAMIIAYRRQDWKNGLQHLERCRDIAPPLMMGLYELYEERIASYLEAPPPVGWDGVYVALSK